MKWGDEADCNVARVRRRYGVDVCGVQGEADHDVLSPPFQSGDDLAGAKGGSRGGVQGDVVGEHRRHAVEVARIGSGYCDVRQMRLTFAAPGFGSAAERLRRAMAKEATAHDAESVVSKAMIRRWLRAGGPLLSGADDMVDVLETIVAEGRGDGDLRVDIPTRRASPLILDA